MYVYVFSKDTITYTLRMGAVICKAVLKHFALHRRMGLLGFEFFSNYVFYLLRDIREKHSLSGSGICSSVLTNLKGKF